MRIQCVKGSVVPDRLAEAGWKLRYITTDQRFVTTLDRGEPVTSLTDVEVWELRLS
jgi:hypothetical protein